MKILRVDIRSSSDQLVSVFEFEGGVETGQAFRKKTGTCTRLFSRLLKQRLEQGYKLVIQEIEK